MVEKTAPPRVPSPEHACGIGLRAAPSSGFSLVRGRPRPEWPPVAAQAGTSQTAKRGTASGSTSLPLSLPACSLAQIQEQLRTVQRRRHRRRRGAPLRHARPCLPGAAQHFVDPSANGEQLRLHSLHLGKAFGWSSDLALSTTAFLNPASALAIPYPLISMPEPHRVGLVVKQQQGSKEEANGCSSPFSSFSIAAKDGPPQQCSL